MTRALRIWRVLPKRRRLQLFMLSILSVLSAISEALAIGSILPFLMVLSEPSRLFQHQAGQLISRWFGLQSPAELLFPVSAVFCIAVLAACALRVLMLWASNRVSFAAGADLADEIFRRTLHQPYSTHLKRSSSDVIDILEGGVNAVVFDVLTPVITIVSSTVIIAAVVSTMVVIDPIVALCAFGGIGSIYVIVALITQRGLVTLGRREALSNRARLTAVQESLGGMRDVLLGGSQGAYFDAFSKANRRSRVSTASKRFIAQSPRYIVEALAMSLVAALAYMLTQQSGGIERSIPVLGAFALGAQRLLPAAQNIFSNWSILKAADAYLSKVSNFFAATKPVSIDVPRSTLPLEFDHCIQFRDVSFKYDASDDCALRNVQVVIPAGSRVGIIGPSGSGKSTFVDILMGLLDPTQGAISVDGCAITEANRRSWQENIAHVPQSVFLGDMSIAENIAFGVPKGSIDYERVEQAARAAQIADFIERQPDGYGTVVGERGVRLSGGQRQRLGIARALYRNAKLLILDEATSALDSETEGAVMRSIEQLSEELTVMMIAHRLTTLAGCTQVLKIEKGEVTAIVTAAELERHE